MFQTEIFLITSCDLFALRVVYCSESPSPVLQFQHETLRILIYHFVMSTHKSAASHVGTVKLT